MEKFIQHIHDQVASNAFWIIFLKWAVQEYVKSLAASIGRKIKMRWRKK